MRTVGGGKCLRRKGWGWKRWRIKQKAIVDGDEDREKRSLMESGAKLTPVKRISMATPRSLSSRIRTPSPSKLIWVKIESFDGIKFWVLVEYGLGYDWFWVMIEFFWWFVLQAANYLNIIRVPWPYVQNCGGYDDRQDSRCTSLRWFHSNSLILSLRNSPPSGKINYQTLISVLIIVQHPLYFCCDCFSFRFDCSLLLRQHWFKHRLISTG